MASDEDRAVIGTCFVATDGRTNGNGLVGSPINLATLAAILPTIWPGSTIRLRAGTYAAALMSRLSGNPQGRIEMRVQDGENIVIDGGYRAQGSRVTLRGLNFLNSSWVNRRETGKPNAVSVELGADRIEIINCLMHDTNHGILSSGQGLQVRGCVVWNVGVAGSSQEHSLYSNNDGSIQSVISGNIFAQGFASWGMHLYSETAGGYVRNVLAENNLHIWQIMLLQTTVEEMSAIVVRNNETLHGQINIGTGGRDHLDLICTGNMICFGKENNCLIVKRFRDLTVTGNTIITDTAPAINFVHSDLTIIQRTWDSNAYHYTGDPARFANNNGVFQSFRQWQAATGFDANSTYAQALPTTNRVRVIPNADDDQRAHIIIHNWEGLAAVNVDLSGLGLTGGATYRLRQAQDPLGDSVTFEYDGDPLAVDMDPHSVAIPTGVLAALNDSTFPVCGAFVLEPA